VSNISSANRLLNDSKYDQKRVNAEKAMLKQQSKNNKTIKLKKKKVDAYTGAPLWWLCTMFFFSCLYLLPEAIFNSALIDVAGGKSSDESDLRIIELFGRAVSGIGVSLLLLDFYYKKRPVHSPFKMILISGAVLLVIWPLVFFGQKALVDNLIISPSSAEERQHAYVVQMLRRALIEKSVEIEGLDYKPNQPHSAEEKTFLSLFAGMAYADTSLINKLESKKEAIIEKFVRDSANNHFLEHYEDYKIFRNDLHKRYERYRKSSVTYNDAANAWQESADKHWLRIENEILQGWSKYQKAEQVFETRVDARAQKIAPKIYKYFESRKKCKTQRCVNRLKSYYDRDIKKYKIPYIHPDDWLIKEQVSTGDNLLNAAVGAVFTMGISVVAQSLDAVTGGDGGFKDYKYTYTNDVEDYKKVLRKHMSGNFIRESGGYKLGIATLSAFRTNSTTSSKVRARLKQKDIKVPPAWTIKDRHSFDLVVQRRVKQIAEQDWQRKAKKKGLDIPPNLSWNRFQLTAPIQAEIRKTMGEDYYVNPMLADWNNRQFLNAVIEPNIQKKTDYYLTVLKAEKKKFSDNGDYENLGKTSLRATLIPPISMSLSLLLVILTAIKLPAKFLEIASFSQQASPAAGGVSQAVKGTIYTLVLIVLIFMLPVTFVNNKYINDKSTVSYFLQKIEQNNAYQVAFILRWAMATQPLVYPLGYSLNQHLGLVNHFDSISADLDSLDEYFFTKKSTTLTKVALPLKIIAEPSGAVIQIMNIKPKYYDGILLKPGHYDIKVSRDGYYSERKRVDLQKGKGSFLFNLIQK